MTGSSKHKRRCSMRRSTRLCEKKNKGQKKAKVTSNVSRVPNFPVMTTNTKRAVRTRRMSSYIHERNKATEFPNRNETKSWSERESRAIPVVTTGRNVCTRNFPGIVISQKKREMPSGDVNKQTENSNKDFSCSESGSQELKDNNSTVDGGKDAKETSVLSEDIMQDECSTDDVEERRTGPNKEDNAADTKRLPCFYCDSSFASQLLWQRHVLESHEEMVHKIEGQTGLKRKCPHCDMYFWKSYKLLRHITSKHSGHPEVLRRMKHLGLISCERGCSRLVAERYFAEHAEQCPMDKPGTTPDGVEGASLDISTARHKSSRVLECHEECIVRASRREMFPCSVSGQHFRHHSTMVIHETSHRSDEDQASEALDENVTKKADLGVKCSVCEELFPSYYLMKKHALVHTGKVLACPFCEKVLCNDSSLSDHINTRHVKKSLFLCQYCGESFVTKAKHRHHLRNEHNEGTQTKPKKDACVCSECGIVTSCESQLKRHIAWYHRGQQSRYKCQYCGVMYRSSHHLDDHIARHLDYKRYQCPVCLKRFTNEGTLHNHMYRFKVHGDLKKYTRSELMLPVPAVIPGETIRRDIPCRLKRAAQSGKKSVTKNKNVLVVGDGAAVKVPAAGELEYGSQNVTTFPKIIRISRRGGPEEVTSKNPVDHAVFADRKESTIVLPIQTEPVPNETLSSLPAEKATTVIKVARDHTVPSSGKRSANAAPFVAQKHVTSDSSLFVEDSGVLLLTQNDLVSTQCRLEPVSNDAAVLVLQPVVPALPQLTGNNHSAFHLITQSDLQLSATVSGTADKFIIDLEKYREMEKIAQQAAHLESSDNVIRIKPAADQSEFVDILTNEEQEDYEVDVVDGEIIRRNGKEGGETPMVSFDTEHVTTDDLQDTEEDLAMVDVMAGRLNNSNVSVQERLAQVAELVKMDEIVDVL